MENKNILVLAAHPNDKTLGCGGAILSYVADGYKVFWLAMTNEVGSRKNKNNNKFILERKKSFIKA